MEFIWPFFYNLFSFGVSKDIMSKVAVQLEMAAESGCPHPKFLQCCHLGMIFMCEKPVDDFKQVEFSLSFSEGSDGNSIVNCKGVVVDSNYEEEHGMYKTYMIYTDIDEQSKARLKTICKERQLRCPYCMNS